MNTCYLRLATENDSELLFNWRNDPDARENSFNKDLISLEEHSVWFKKELENNDESLFILMNADNAIGQIRLSKKNKEIIISYSIDKKYRGQGYGKLILKLAENELIHNSKDIQLHAFVLKQNIASQIIFEMLGYTKEENEDCFEYKKIANHNLFGKIQQDKNIRGGVLLLTNNRNALPLFFWFEKHEKVVLYSGHLNIDMLKILNPKIIVSYNYKFIIKTDIIDFMNGNIINMHISYLPWNRGSSPNIWSFIDNTPKGVTIHKIDKGLDTGEIIVQKEIRFDENKETLKTTYDILNKEIVKLLQENWKRILSGNYKPYKNDEQGSYHTTKDLLEYLQGKIIPYNIPINQLQKMIELQNRKN